MIDFRKRTMSSFGLSIGTGLMLESIFNPTTPRYDESREIPNKVDVNEYKYHFINLITIVRNIVQAFEVKVDPLVILKDKGLPSVVCEEILTIYGLYSTCPINLVFYYSDVKKLSEIYNKSKDRKETQPLLLNKAIQEFLNKMNFKVLLPSAIKISSNLTSIPLIDRRDKMLITTNIPVDLCNPNQTTLLDTHTGILHGPNNFYKKYNALGSKDMSSIPFKEKLLYLIGDKNLSMIINTAIRTSIFEMSLRNRWNFLTSDIKIDSELRKDNEINTFLKSFKGVY